MCSKDKTLDINVNKGHKVYFYNAISVFNKMPNSLKIYVYRDMVNTWTENAKV